jgi:hypothetical protein
MDPIAHGPGHALTDHLKEVAGLTARHAPAGAQAWAHLAGLWHDLGKFRDLAQLEELERRLLTILDLEHDCLRLYRLSDATGCEVREHGRFRAQDFDAPLVV